MNFVPEIQEINDLLTASIKSLKKTSQTYATAERDYKITLRSEALRLRSEDMPVTLIDKVIYGEPKVAEARFKRDIAEANYKANQEAINSYKLQMRLMESQVQREWGSEV